jgi:nucleoid-associated protein EbfC
MSKGLAGIMKQAQMIQSRMAQLQESAAENRAEASSGGGAVSAVVNGKNQLLSLTISQEVVNPADTEMLQDLVMAAINEAQSKAQTKLSGEMSKIAGGLSIPGLF